MPVCPICAEPQDADQAAFEHHVNQHFSSNPTAGPTGGHDNNRFKLLQGTGLSRSDLDHAYVRETKGLSGASTDHTRYACFCAVYHYYPVVTASQAEVSSLFALTSFELETCPICQFPLSYLTPSEVETHLDACLDPPPTSTATSSASHPTSESVSQTHALSKGSSSSRKRNYEAAKPAANPPPNAHDLAQSRNSGTDWEMEMEADDDRDYVHDFSVNGNSAMQGQGRDGKCHRNEVDEGWDGPAKPGGWMDWASKKVERGDKWWDPIDGSTDILPPNFSPGLILALAQVLRAAAHQKVTRRAVLCRDVVHIKGIWKFDMGWGCGYRNAQMAMTSLLSIKAYQPIFDMVNNGSEPGIRRIQSWIQEAWGEGYDREGSKQLKGKILGTRKWIGPSDLYAMFTYKRIPCELYDFPKPKDTQDGSRTAHIALQQWVKAYFGPSEPHQQRSAFDVMMHTTDDGLGRGEAVRVSNKFPLILQHSGHSRTIVGYEENARGDINLLLFDPGRSIPKDIRSVALNQFELQQQQRHQRCPPETSRQSSHSTTIAASVAANSTSLDTNEQRSTRRPSLPPLLTKKSSKSNNSLENTHESRPFSPPFTNGHAEVMYPSLAKPIAMRDSDEGKSIGERGSERQSWGQGQGPGSDHIRGGAVNSSDIQLEDDEEITPSGWVRKKQSTQDHTSAYARTGSTSAVSTFSPSSGFTSKFKSKLTSSGSGPSSSAASRGYISAGVGSLDTIKTLNYFRVNLGALSKQTQYQVLAFTGGEVLSTDERERRKEIRSTVVRA
ncbi:hypothetical protein I317_07043 [Kwoniella heveanensis CBS 569]|nr:hypothetical protein I317_07043 [Kwoniella heveanensis CBS 569]